MAKRNGSTLESAATKLWIGYGVIVALKGRKFDNLVETLVESPRLQSTTTAPNFLMACDLHRAVAAPFSLLEYAGSILRTASRQCEEASSSNSGLQRPCIQWTWLVACGTLPVFNVHDRETGESNVDVSASDPLELWEWAAYAHRRREDIARGGRMDCPIWQIKVHCKEMSGNHSGICHSNCMRLVVNTTIMATKPNRWWMRV